jgi:glutamine synthetase
MQRLADQNIKLVIASELEFYVFEESQKSASQKKWQNLETTASPHHRCLHLQAGSQDEPFMRELRQQLEAAGTA